MAVGSFLVFMLVVYEDCWNLRTEEMAQELTKTLRSFVTSCIQKNKLMKIEWLINNYN